MSSLTILASLVSKDGKAVGVFDGEFFYTNEGVPFMRLDGDELYDLKQPCQFLGTFESDYLYGLQGDIIFTLKRNE
ncbi:hypothetical protein [Vibrio metschnikovii]|uniref:hypothetical protein n=1 Tax=Vibrio metschnikovii TaxID=28172 RepID=UPI001C2F5449|nr:hypothetical protein [Vibrio metschnikovii]